jgi:hypothetical protein
MSNRDRMVVRGGGAGDKSRFRLLALAGCVSLGLLWAGCNGGNNGLPPPASIPPAFVPNTFVFWDNPTFWTTIYGPAFANAVAASTNFLPCRGGPYALCYYSGPAPNTCTLTADGRFADCQCFEIPYGVYFVDINAILNYPVYLQTVAQCGADGSKCQTINSAPVCRPISQGTLIPGAQLNSTFSFDCVPTNGIGQTNCGKAPYVGCMTTPCWESGQAGVATCQCPVWDGPYQVGQNDQQCSLGGNLVWSAAYAPPASPAPSATSTATTGATFPTPPSCVPDAPGGVGCPLYKPGQTVLPPGSGVSCTKVCAEYAGCAQGGIDVGFTCDATLCTDNCDDRDLVGTACNGLSQCDISEIVKVETAAQCSCCASQLCGCSADSPTNNEIFTLNQAQRARGVTPQCDINGTLCGSP